MRISALLVLALAIPLSVWSDPIWVGRFNPDESTLPAPWHIKSLDADVAPTRYRPREWDGVGAIEAHAVNSMALLARPLAVDLAKTPVLCWRWRIDAPLRQADMTRKSADDYAARVYLSFQVPAETLGLATRVALGLARTLRGKDVPDAAVNYVWDNRQSVGTWRPSAYTDRSRMLVLRSGSQDAGHWVEERRDVLEDFTQAFGHEPTAITGIAIATDTDNTGEEARAGFADFRFVARGDSC